MLLKPSERLKEPREAGHGLIMVTRLRLNAARLKMRVRVRETKGLGLSSQDFGMRHIADS